MCFIFWPFIYFSLSLALALALALANLKGAKIASHSIGKALLYLKLELGSPQVLI
jgi:hypothetical protein